MPLGLVALVDQPSEVARFLALGAAHADIGQGPDVSWVVMTDPEGNEFCILTPLTPEQTSELDAIRRNRRP